MLNGKKSAILLRKLIYYFILIGKKAGIFINYAKNILGENIKLTLSRYHLTENVTHVGNWHRDALPNKELTSLQINLYLFNEKGIQILPKSHLKELSDENKLKISKSPFSSLKNFPLI